MALTGRTAMNETHRKAFETARARCALRSIVLHRIEDDAGRPLFIATFHALTKHFDTLDEVEQWLLAVDGKPAIQP